MTGLRGLLCYDASPQCHVERSACRAVASCEGWETSLIVLSCIRRHDYWVYILTNKHCTTLYIGVTNDMERRLYQHRAGDLEGFTERYHLHRLVWLEHFGDVNDAIACEKKLKGWRRSRKVALMNDRIHAGWI